MNPFSLSIAELESRARSIRRRIIVLNAESPAGGHTGADLSQVELLTALYFRILNCSPQLKDSDERDIYIQSKGHAVGGYYCVLAEAGFIPVEWLSTYQHADSHLPGHPVKHKTPGIEPEHWSAGAWPAGGGGDRAGRETQQQQTPGVCGDRRR
ncbi:Transketolase [Leclercia adecarboxylata]|uniref:Transketolase n=1 Tax=Leclercia adecarboxylata TaxID=83655 RepID=A0A4U9HLE5_9ENTR|nr:Transketolase [Leclercia adecarboxylata]